LLVLLKAVELGAGNQQQFTDQLQFLVFTSDANLPGRIDDPGGAGLTPETIRQAGASPGVDRSPKECVHRWGRAGTADGSAHFSVSDQVGSLYLQIILKS